MNVQRFAQLFEEGGQGVEEELRKVAQSIAHCGDYGTCYWDEKTGGVFWCAGDADGDGEYTPFDEIKQRFLAVDGVKSVDIECEAGEPEGWKEIEYNRDARPKTRDD